MFRLHRLTRALVICFLDNDIEPRFTVAYLAYWNATDTLCSSPSYGDTNDGSNGPASLGLA